MRRFLTVLLVFVLLSVFSFSASQLQVVYPKSIAYHRAYLNSGWYWIRSSGAWFEWNFSSIPHLPSTVYINVSALVTSGFNGGSGFSEDVQWEILNLSDDSILRAGKISLRNPFLPRVRYFTNGLGYKAYGSVVIKLDSATHIIMEREGFKFRIIWPGAHRYHVAFNKNPKYLFLVYER